MNVPIPAFRPNPLTCLVALAAGLLTACADTDIEKPTITLNANFSAVGDTLALDANTEVNFDMFISDDGQLTEYRVVLWPDTVNSSEVARSEVGGLSSGTDVVSFTEAWNAEAKGRWNLLLEAADDGGNKGEFRTSIVVTNTAVPDIRAVYWNVANDLDELDFNGEDTLKVGLQATDPEGLASLAVRWLQSEALVGEVQADVTSGAFDDTLTVPVPETVLTGDVLEILGADAAGNSARYRYSITR